MRIEDRKELLAGDGFLLQQVLRDLIDFLAILQQDIDRALMLCTDDIEDLLVDDLSVASLQRLIGLPSR